MLTYLLVVSEVVMLVTVVELVVLEDWTAFTNSVTALQTFLLNGYLFRFTLFKIY